MRKPHDCLFFFFFFFVLLFVLFFLPFKKKQKKNYLQGARAALHAFFLAGRLKNQPRGLHQQQRLQQQRSRPARRPIRDAEKKTAPAVIEDPWRMRAARRRMEG